MKTELKASLPLVTKYANLTAIFTFFFAASILPFMAFLVIGLGMLMDDQYWLSALIVAATFALISAPLAFYFFRKLKKLDFSFEHSRAGLSKGLDVVQSKVAAVLEASKGEHCESSELH